jgi:hypothetical protein
MTDQLARAGAAIPACWPEAEPLAVALRGPLLRPFD